MDKQHQGCSEMVKQSSEYLHPYSLWNHNWSLYQGKLFGFCVVLFVIFSFKTRSLFKVFYAFCFHIQKKIFGNQFTDAVVAGWIINREEMDVRKFQMWWNEFMQLATLSDIFRITKLCSFIRLVGSCSCWTSCTWDIARAVTSLSSDRYFQLTGSSCSPCRVSF